MDMILQSENFLEKHLIVIKFHISLINGLLQFNLKFSQSTLFLTVCFFRLLKYSSKFD